MKITLVLSPYYAWCDGHFGRHYRQIQAHFNGAPLCADCAGYLKQNGYTCERENPAPPTPKPKRPYKPRKKLSPSFKSRLRDRILPLLSEDAYTATELLEKCSDLTKSLQRLNLLLWELKRDGLICARPLPPKGMLAYCLPEQKESVAQKFNLSYKEDILRILGNEAMTIKELTSRLRRPRPTVGRWVQQMEAEGTLRSETRVIPGVSGIHKFCWVKDG